MLTITCVLCFYQVYLILYGLSILLRTVDLCIPELIKQVSYNYIIVLVLTTLSVTVKEQVGLGLGGCRRQRPHCDSSGSCKSEKLNMQLPRAEAVSSQ